MPTTALYALLAISVFGMLIGLWSICGYPFTKRTPPPYIISNIGVFILIYSGLLFFVTLLSILTDQG